SGQRHPPERPPPLAERVPNEGRHKSRIRKRVLHPRQLCLRSQIVPVVERHRTPPLHFQNRFHVLRHCRPHATLIFLRLRSPQHIQLLIRLRRRQISPQRIMCARLICNQIRHKFPSHHLRQNH